MLLNLSGAHGPDFARNVVLLGDSSGRIGVGEVPGGERIRKTLEDAIPLVVGQPIATYNAVLQAMDRAFADRDTGGRGPQTFDLRVAIHAKTAVEAANALYRDKALGARDDAAGMQYLIPGWTFGSKRSCLVRQGRNIRKGEDK